MKMYYLVDSLIDGLDWFTTEVVFLIIVAILLVIAIIVLTIMKKIKDK
jgi:hypothetical protein